MAIDDPVNSPKHYTQGDMEVITAIEGMGLDYHQGNAADLMRDRVVRISTHLDKHYASHIVNIVHDEVIIDATISEVHDLTKIIPTLMGNKTVEEFVRIETDCEWSTTNWAEKEEYTWQSKTQ